MSPVPVSVRPVEPEDLPLLERELANGPVGKHRERLERQQRGEVIYLIAWLGQVPLGHALLKWAGAAEAYLQDHFRGTCPDIEDLLVAEAWRSRGIGTQLLEAAERLAMDRGYARIGLAVDVRNPRAHALYERLGYQDAGLGVHREKYTYVDAEGLVQSWDEIAVYLAKQLG